MTAPAVPVLTKAAARKLTARIQGAVGELWELLGEAHDREAWRVLGYASWAAYVDAEFAISRGQSYRLLDQARVTHALEEATGDPDARGAVSARQAHTLRDDPDRAAQRIAKRAAKGEPIGDAVAGEVARVRSRQTSKQGSGKGGDPTGSPTPAGGRGGAAATAEKVAEAPTATPKPTRGSTPPSRGDEATPAPPRSSGSPATADGVRHMVAMVVTTGAAQIAHCCEARAIAAAIDTLTAALRAKQPQPKNGSAARPMPARSRDVTPIPKGGKR